MAMPARMQISWFPSLRWQREPFSLQNIRNILLLYNFQQHNIIIQNISTVCLMLQIDIYWLLDVSIISSDNRSIQILWSLLAFENKSFFISDCKDKAYWCKFKPQWKCSLTAIMKRYCPKKCGKCRWVDLMNNQTLNNINIMRKFS